MTSTVFVLIMNRATHAPRIVEVVMLSVAMARVTVLRAKTAIPVQQTAYVKHWTPCPTDVSPRPLEDAMNVVANPVYAIWNLHAVPPAGLLNACNFAVNAEAATWSTAITVKAPFMTTHSLEKQAAITTP